VLEIVEGDLLEVDLALVDGDRRHLGGAACLLYTSDAADEED